jgi:hypothetical protein
VKGRDKNRHTEQRHSLMNLKQIHTMYKMHFFIETLIPSLNKAMSLRKCILIKIMIIYFSFFNHSSHCLAFNLSSIQNPKTCTALFYLNGDNNLSHEVLYALDMLETVGSSDEMNLLVLYDGKAGFDHGYGDEWGGTKLLYITHDEQIGKINSPILKDMGEQNLGNPATLEKFVQYSMNFKAERYFFVTFSHGRGIIDTHSFTSTGPHKSLAISIDETDDNDSLSMQQFHGALKSGLQGEKFELVILFSCLTNMVEVGYALKDVTDYLVGSEDEIRIVNNPPGAFQVRGIKFEEPFGKLRENPHLSIYNLAKITIDCFIEQYSAELKLKNIFGQSYKCRYPAGLALVNCNEYNQLAQRLNHIARYINQRISHPRRAMDLAKELRITFPAVQRYHSFLNLEYYDLKDFLLKLEDTTADLTLKGLCAETHEFIDRDVILYERHTIDTSSNGISIYISHSSVPDNIFNAHQRQYRQSFFSKDTAWDEMIETVRRKLRMEVKD